ncbi:hypothetical protein SAMN04515647_2853 [Cohaesibacter sp. ES.047]|uniref:hypothetical protein n=1 Tax=Cohaesibacter sp. ES.047 TaxID=1798205 RepID=UPI000BB6C5B9|nr:hypothetical protein [Cohaesibacter sp. ES.047]SNY92581.1 hypothetical protein SAMN04515647_2853 [Cohaesibacter sp. ES.047]
MISIAKKKAEERLAAVQKSQKAALNEQEERVSKVRANTARLKAMRLAKEEEDSKNPPPAKATRKRAKPK